MEQCKARCEDGTWHGCKGFSRYIYQHGVDQKGVCWWVTSSDLFFRDEAGGDEEILYTRDAKGLRNATHDHLAGCCYRGVKSGYCAGNTAVCTVDCGSDSVRKLRIIFINAGFVVQLWSILLRSFTNAILLSLSSPLLPLHPSPPSSYSKADWNGLNLLQCRTTPRRWSSSEPCTCSATATLKLMQRARWKTISNLLLTQAIKMHYLGQAYKDGLFGVERNEQAAWMWYQLSAKKARAVSDAEALSDSTAGLAALVLRNDGDSGECDADCQTLVRAKVYEWSPKDVCQLPGAEKTRDSFCSGFGTPTSTVTNDEVSHYMSCQCVCDDGYYNDPGDASGCLAGVDTTTTTQTLLPTTTTTTTKSRNCKYHGGVKFLGPWTGRSVGAGGNGDGVPMLSARKSTVNGCGYYCVDNGGCLGFV